MKEFWFQGGSGGGNVIRSFTADVPSPLAGFDNYAYWSNRDRKVVHKITGYRQLIAERELLYDDAYRTSVLEKARIEIEQLKSAWQEKYGFFYVPVNESGLWWEATEIGVRSTIGVWGGEYIYIECENVELAEKAHDIAWDSVFD